MKECFGENSILKYSNYQLLWYNNIDRTMTPQGSGGRCESRIIQMERHGVKMKTIRWGIIGAGNIATTFATALNGMKDTKLVAVASRDIERAMKFATNYQVEKAYGSYEEIIKDSEIDVIYIATPHTEHKANAELCIKNGKSVLCEKPFTINEKEARYLMDLAKEHKVFLMEAMWTKFLPATKKVKQWIADGKIGKIQNMQISFGFQVTYNEANRLFDFAVAGGALLDAGVYPVTYATHIMGKLPDQVLSTAIMGKSGVDEQNCMIFKYNDGVIATLRSGITVSMENDAIIIGDKGRIVVRDFLRANQAVLCDTKGNTIESFQEDGRINGYEYEAYEVNQCLREGKLESSYLPVMDTLNIMKVMDSMRADWGLKYKQEID